MSELVVCWSKKGIAMGAAKNCDLPSGLSRNDICNPGLKVWPKSKFNWWHVGPSLRCSIRIWGLTACWDCYNGIVGHARDYPETGLKESPSFLFYFSPCKCLIGEQLEIYWHIFDNSTLTLCCEQTFLQQCIDKIKYKM